MKTEILAAYYVLSAISNDYEDFSMVSSEVSKWAREDNLTISEQEVFAMLRKLIKEGYAQAYTKPNLSSPPMPAELSEDNARSVYYFVTPKGKQLVVALDKLS